MACKNSDLLTLEGTFNGWQKVDYTDRETGEAKISRRFKLMLIDSLHSTEEEFATYELHFRVPEDSELIIPVMRPGTACRVVCAFRQDKSHDNWRVNLVSVEAI